MGEGDDFGVAAMKGVCQRCGATADLEWFLVDAQYKACLCVMAKMPRDVAQISLRYLGLFRPASGRSISPIKALRLLEELWNLVGPGHVQVGRMPSRQCPARMWAEAMEQMLANPKLRLPMKNHNYLCQVAYDLADRADAEMERTRNEMERNGGLRATSTPLDPPMNGGKVAEDGYATMSEADWSRLPEAVRQVNAHRREHADQD